MRVEVFSVLLVTALSSCFFPAKVQAQNCNNANGALKQKRSNHDSSCTVPGFTQGPLNMTLTVGTGTVQLMCQIDGDFPQTGIVWKHLLHGRELEIVQLNANENAALFTFDSGTLTFNGQVSIRHHGEYQCTLQAPCSHLFSTIGYIEVKGPSLVKWAGNDDMSTQRNVSVGSQLVIELNVFGSPEPELTLLKRIQSRKRAADDYQTVDNSDNRISVDASAITFSSVKFTDEGMYRLWANNTEGGTMLEFTVDVTGVVRPTVSLTTSKLTPTSYGNIAKEVNCSVPREAFDTDSGVLTIEWLRKSDMVKVALTGDIYQSKVNYTAVTLNLEVLREGDNGEYLCVANNSKGMSNNSFRITGPPSMVTDVTATSTVSAIELEWTPPNSYGAVIDHYFIRYNYIGDDIMIMKNVSHVSEGEQKQKRTFPDLCPIGVWSFIISAVNEFNAMGEDSNMMRATISGSHCESVTSTTSTSTTLITRLSSTSTTVSTSQPITSNPTVGSVSSQSASSVPIAIGAAAGAFILIVLIAVLIVAIACYMTISGRGSKSRAEQQWSHRYSTDRIDNGYVESNTAQAQVHVPAKSPEPLVNGIGMDIPSPITGIEGYGPIYIDPRYEFPREDLELTDILYDGTFTVIYKAKAVGIKETKPIDVAVKCLKEEYLEFDDYSSALIMEMEQLAQLEPHPNIVTLIRVCSVSRPVLMVMEYMCHGDLLGFLRTTRGHTDMYTVNPGTKNLPTQLKLTSRDLLNIIRQVANGMQFLSEQKIIHGALCARNILVGTSMEVKIFNIGVHNLDNDESFESLVRWMAPEVFVDAVRTTYGDVWSFGILMWEVVTLGGTPYADMVTDDLYTQLMSGVRLQKPQHCAQPVYDVMALCWETIPQHRPLFYEICDHLENLNLSKMSYLDLKKYNDTVYSQFDDSEKQLTSIL